METPTTNGHKVNSFYILDSPEILFPIKEILKHTDAEFGPWLAGGAPRRVFEKSLGKKNIAPNNDYDFFFSSSLQVEYFRKRIESKGWVYEDEGQLETGEPYAAGMCPLSFKNSSFDDKIQLIFGKYYDSIACLFDSFDYMHCCVAISDNQLFYTEPAKKAILNKMLVVNKITNYRSSLFRIYKYALQGFRPSYETLECFAKGELLQIGENDDTIH